MSGTVIDARKKDCPQPVLETRKALKDSRDNKLMVLVDNEAAAENVARMARSMGCEVALEDSGGGEFRLRLTREEGGDDGVDTRPAADPCGTVSKTAVFLASQTIGHGDDDLGRLLMVAFVRTLKELVPRPSNLLLMNDGVKLALEESELIGVLKQLESEGMEVLVCGTCLDFFNVKDRLAVGEVSNMFEMSSRMVEADRVIRP